MTSLFPPFLAHSLSLGRTCPIAQLSKEVDIQRPPVFHEFLLPPHLETGLKSPCLCHISPPPPTTSAPGRFERFEKRPAPKLSVMVGQARGFLASSRGGGLCTHTGPHVCTMHPHNAVHAQVGRMQKGHKSLNMTDVDHKQQIWPWAPYLSSPLLEKVGTESRPVHKIQEGYRQGRNRIFPEAST